MIGNVVYTHSKTSNGYPLGTEAYYKCAGETNEHKVVCKMSGWSGSQGEPKCCKFYLFFYICQFKSWIVWPEWSSQKVRSLLAHALYQPYQ